MAFHVGQKVVCVELNEHPERRSLLVKGAIYTIAWVGIESTEFGECESVDLIEIPFLGDDEWARGYDPGCFRPLTDRKSEVFFTMGADPESEKWDNRKRVKVRS